MNVDVEAMDWEPQLLSSEKYEQVLYHIGLNDVNGLINVLQGYNVVPFREHLHSRNFVHLAAIQGSAVCIRYFVSAGCEVNVRDALSFTPLLLAMTLCDADTRPYVVAELLEAGAKTNILSPQGQSPFNMCFAEDPVYIDDLESAELLVDAGCDVNENFNGTTALQKAVIAHKLESVRFLLNRGAKLINQGPGEGTLLHQASRPSSSRRLLHRSEADIEIRYEISKLLLEKGANPNAFLDSTCTTPFHYVLSYADLRTVKLFLEHGAVWDLEDVDSRGAIHFAASNYHTDVLRFVVAEGGEPDDRMEQGETTLHIAVRDRALDNIRYLVRECGIDLSVKNSSGETPLMSLIGDLASDGFAHWAEEYELELLIDTLLELGASLNGKTTSMQFLIDLAAETDVDTVRKYMLRILARVHYNGGNIGRRQYRKIQKQSEMKTYFEKCIQELTDLKERSIEGLPLWPVLQNHRENIAMKYSCNRGFVQAFETINWHEDFPVFGYRMKCNLQVQLLKKQLRCDTIVALNMVLPTHIATDLIKRGIVNYVSVKDQVRIVNQHDTYALLSSSDELALNPNVD